MGYGVPCEICLDEYFKGKRTKRNVKEATEIHHKFSQTKKNRELYGDLLDKRANLVYLCYEHHHNYNPPRWSELDFCKALGIEPRSKLNKKKGV